MGRLLVRGSRENRCGCGSIGLIEWIIRGEGKQNAGAPQPPRGSALLKDPGKIAAAEEDALDPDCLILHPEEDDVVSDDSQPRIFADVGAELIVQRAVADPAEGFANLTDKTDRAARVVFCNPVGDLFQVAFDET